MRMMRIGLSLAIFVAFGAVVGWRLWHGSAEASAPSLAQASGPAVILFRGDNDPDCRAVYHLVDQAAARYGNGIHFVRVARSSDNPLIKKYRIRFLPTVVFLDRHDKVVDRIVGESPKVRKELAHEFSRIKALLRQ